MEFWRLVSYVRTREQLARTASTAEDQGWSGIGIGENQSTVGDPFIGMALALNATATLKAGVSVTNPLTRHPAVVANSVATLQNEFGGRAVLGVGRGDSSLAHLGLAPAPLSVFESFLTRLQAYLRAEDVPFEGADGRGEVERWGARDGATAPTHSHMCPPAPGDAKVPVSVAASGPRVIELAARLADEVLLAVGASPERIAWAVELARRSRADAGLEPRAGVSAYVPMVLHPDQAKAREQIRGAVASFARYAVMKGKVIGPASESQRTTLEALHDVYDMSMHFTSGSPQARVLTDEVIDMFGIAGPAGYCIERIQELADVGVTKTFVLASAYGLDREAYEASLREIIDTVGSVFS